MQGIDHRSNKESNGLSLRDYFKQPTRGGWPVSFVYMLNMSLFGNLKASASVQRFLGNENVAFLALEEQI